MHNISVRDKNNGCLVVARRPSDETRKYTSDDFGPSVYRAIGILAALEEMFFALQKMKRKRAGLNKATFFHWSLENQNIY